jgi:serine/threonine-protein kinase
VAYTLNNLGCLMLDQGRYEEARQWLEQAVALQERAQGPEDTDLGYYLSSLGRALTGQRRYAEARQRIERALALHEKLLGREHPELATTLRALGELELAQGRTAQAVPLLERALALAPLSDRARVQFALAQALWSTPQARPRALQLATQARELWQRFGHQPRVAEASRWLDAHSRP